ncbi:MBL fold metallo-hydrolase [Paenibacillus profundus]|uniref:MBL fold metallo-hydrolase n=1 Tax=Paenibacillus profundus TaxID=1173085 RepID=A0ABS8YGX0_9BACL|nr:MBL fold metallo-hydrolase [Paenibacillus profundus]MCE5170352.1 MBL fold metallo-hydrolase [Paenibacillus profundus]
MGDNLEVRTEVQLNLMTAGYCTHREWLTIQGGSFGSVRFPAMFAYIEHPRLGTVLFDTGYSERFFQATSAFPAKLYRWTTPVYICEEETAAHQLRALGVPPERVQKIILSHFHADHIGGVRDFPNAEFYYLRTAYRPLQDMSTFRATKAGFLPELLPDRFGERSLPIEETCSKISLNEGYAPFTEGYDLFGDGSVIGIDVSGHAPGQLGLLLRATGQEYFLCADAAWSTAAYASHRLPKPIVKWIKADWRQYKDNLHRLHVLHRQRPELLIIPTHCREAEQRYVLGSEIKGDARRG